MRLDLSGYGDTFPDPDKTYSVRGRCSNCGWTDRLILRKGERAPGNRSPGFVIDTPSATCPKCGCWTVTA